MNCRGVLWCSGWFGRRFLRVASGAKESALAHGKEEGKWRAECAGPLWDGSLPILDHQLKLFHQGVDLLEIFAAPFLRSEIQGATKGDHVA